MQYFHTFFQIFTIACIIFIPVSFISYLNVLSLYLVFIPGSESSAEADSDSLAASDTEGSTGDQASAARKSIRQKSRTARRTWLIPKFHAIWHLATSIRLFGRLVRSEGGVAYCAVSAKQMCN